MTQMNHERKVNRPDDIKAWKSTHMQKPDEEQRDVTESALSQQSMAYGIDI